GSEVVNVVDDPTVEHAIAYYRTDDEGVKARRRYLYKEGRVTEFLQNRETAAAMHTRSNGAARAVNYNVEAIVRMANTFVDPKDDVSSRIVEKAISLGCQDAIADVITNRSYQIRFAQNEAVISNRWRESTASVFFVYDKRVLASDIKDLTQLDAAVERLVKI